MLFPSEKFLFYSCKIFLMSISKTLYNSNEFIPRVIKCKSIALPNLSMSETVIKSNRYEEQIWIPMCVLGKDLWSCEGIWKGDRSYHWYSKGDSEIADGDDIGQSKGSPPYLFRVAYVCVTAAMAMGSSTDPPAISASRYESGNEPLLSLPASYWIIFHTFHFCSSC